MVAVNGVGYVNWLETSHREAMKDADYRAMYAKDYAEVAATAITTREDALYEFILGVLIENPNSLWMSAGDITRYAKKQFPTVELQTLASVTKRARDDFLVTPLALERQLITTKSTSDVAKKFEPDAPTTTAAKVVSVAAKVPGVTVKEALNKFEKLYSAIEKKWLGRAAEVAAAEVAAVAPVVVMAAAEVAAVAPVVVMAAADMPAITDDEHQTMYDAHRKKTEATVARRAKAAAVKVQRAKSEVRSILLDANVDVEDVGEADITPIKKTRQRRQAKVVVVADVAPIKKTRQRRQAKVVHAEAVVAEEVAVEAVVAEEVVVEAVVAETVVVEAVVAEAVVVEAVVVEAVVVEAVVAEAVVAEAVVAEAVVVEADSFWEDGSEPVITEVIDEELAGVQVVSVHAEQGILQRPITLSLPFTYPDPDKLLWADGSTPVLTEVIDGEMSKKIYDNFTQLMTEKRLDVWVETVKILPRFYKRFVKGEFEVHYYQLDFGRFYAKGGMSLGCIQREIRGALTERMFDIDIVNCHPSIAYNFCIQNSIPCPLLSQYVKCRESFVKSIPIFDGEEPVTKQTICMLMNGGGCPNKGLADFKKEMKTIVDRVFFLFPKMRETVASDVDNRRAKICSRVWMMIESQLQRMAMKIFHDAGFVIRVSTYDGFMIDKHATLSAEVSLRESERQILEATGYSISFIIKPLPTINFDGFVPNPVRTYVPRPRIVGTYAQYNPIIHDEFQVQPFFTRGMLGKMTFSPGVRVVGICAPMGSGKSHQVRACVEALSQGEPHFKCLDVSSRRTQGSATLAELNKGCYGFESYRNGNFEADRLTVQFESLHKVPIDHVYDLLILDEIRSILDCATSSTNKGKWDANVIALRNLIVGAKRVVMCDADMLVDDAVSVMLEEFFPNRSCVELHIYTQTQSDYIKKIVIRNRDDVIGSLRHDMRTGKRIGVVCPLRESVQHVDQLAQDERVTVKYFHGLSDEGEKVTCWMDPDGEFATTQVVVFNSAVTVGNDIQLPFDNLYVLADSAYGCNFRQLTQMMGRFRRVKSDEVHMSVFEDTVNYVSCLTDEKLIERDRGETKYALQMLFTRRDEHISHYKLERDDDGARWCPDWIIKVRAHNEVLAKKHNFKNRFVEHQLFRGMTVEDRTTEPDSTRCYVDISERIANMSTYQQQIIQYQRILSTNGKLADGLEVFRMRDHVQLNEDQVVMVEMWKTVKPFVFVDQDTREMRIPDGSIKDADPFTDDKIEMPELRFIRRNSGNLMRLIHLIKGLEDHPRTVSYADQSGSLLYRRAFVCLLSKLTNSNVTDVAGFLREEHTVLIKDIKSAEDAASNLEILTGMGSPRTSADDEDKRVVGYVNHILKYFCLSLGAGKRVRVGKGGRVNKYTITVAAGASKIVAMALDDNYSPLVGLWSRPDATNVKRGQARRLVQQHNEPMRVVPDDDEFFPAVVPEQGSRQRPGDTEEAIHVATALIEAEVTEMPGWKVLALNRTPAPIEETQLQHPLEPERARPPPFAFSTDTPDLKGSERAQRIKHAFSACDTGGSPESNASKLFEVEVGRSDDMEKSHRHTIANIKKYKARDSLAHKHRVMLDRERMLIIAREREELERLQHG
jgi:hypothetical protein